MFTVMQSMEIAHEIQADHRRRAATWRFARRPHGHQTDLRAVGMTAPVVELPRPAVVVLVRDVA